MTSLVTGANGFVGRALCSRLERDGESVRRVMRATIGDIADVMDWRPHLEGVDTVYHLAARVHVMREGAADASAAYRRINVDATVALARAAAEAGVRSFVFVSSVKAAAEHSGAQPLRESDTAMPEDEYGRSKLEAERALDRIRAASRMHVTALRPPLIYGPGVKANFFRLMQAVDRFMPLPMGAIHNARSLLYVGNFVDAMVRCAGAGEIASRTFYVSDGEDVSTATLVREIARALGRPALLLPVPVSMLRSAGELLRRQATVERLTSSLAIDSSALRRTLGWTPPVSMREGIEETASWYRQVR